MPPCLGHEKTQVRIPGKAKEDKGYSCPPAGLWTGRHTRLRGPMLQMPLPQIPQRHMPHCEKQRGCCLTGISKGGLNAGQHDKKDFSCLHGFQGVDRLDSLSPARPFRPIWQLRASTPSRPCRRPPWSITQHQCLSSSCGLWLFRNKVVGWCSTKAFNKGMPGGLLIA